MYSIVHQPLSGADGRVDGVLRGRQHFEPEHESACQSSFLPAPPSSLCCPLVCFFFFFFFFWSCDSPAPLCSVKLDAGSKAELKTLSASHLQKLKVSVALTTPAGKPFAPHQVRISPWVCPAAWPAGWVCCPLKHAPTLLPEHCNSSCGDCEGDKARESRRVWTCDPLSPRPFHSPAVAWPAPFGAF